MRSAGIRQNPEMYYIRLIINAIRIRARPNYKTDRGTTPVASQYTGCPKYKIAPLMQWTGYKLQLHRDSTTARVFHATVL